MKNQTFAAYRHLPTDAVHILDLALFSKQTTPDGAMSLACEYIDYEGEKAFAVIASGEQDEPGVTYAPLSEKENAEIMDAWFANPVSYEWECETVIGEYKFSVAYSHPDHVIAILEFIEPKNA